MIVDLMLTGLLSVMAGTATLPAVDDDFWYSSWGPLLLSGDVTPDTSLQTTAVMACVAKRTQSFAALPFHLYGKGGPAWPGSNRQSRYRASDHPLERLLNYQPNDWQTAYEFREMMEGHLCMRGNAYAVIVPGRLGAVTQLIPKHPDRMIVGRLTTGRLGYVYTNKQGRQEKYTQDQIFHLRWFSVDGITGLGPIALQRRAVELAQQAEKHGTKYFTAGKPLGAIKMPKDKTMGEDEDAHRRFRKQWREAYGGDDLYSVAILEDGMEWQQLGLTNEDAQYLDARRFQVVEICRMFDVPPHLIYSAIEHGHTYANVEQSDLFFAKHCLMLWVKRWEQAIWRDLLVDQDQFYPKFSLEGLLRADTNDRGNWYDKMIGLGVYNPNDVCELEERDPHPDGEQYYVRSDLIPIGSAGVAPATVAPSATREEDAEAWSHVEIAAGPQYLTNDTPAEIEQVEPSEISQPYSDNVLHAWAEDIARRLAHAERRAIGEHIGKAAEDHEQFVQWLVSYAEKHRKYVHKSLGEFAIVAEGKANNSVEASVLVGLLASSVCSSLTDAFLLDQEPAKAFKHWPEKRASEIVRVLLQEES